MVYPGTPSPPFKSVVAQVRAAAGVGFGPRPFYMLGDATSCMIVGFIYVHPYR